MDFLPFVALLALQGLFIGACARLALPGPDPMSILQTMAVGLGGSLLAGLLVYALTDGREAPGALASLAFATLIVYVVRRRRGGGLTRPSGATPPEESRAASSGAPGSGEAPPR